MVISGKVYIWILWCQFVALCFRFITVQELVPHTSVCGRITLWPDLDLALHRTLSPGRTECELEEKKETTWKQSNFFSEW